MLLTRRIWWVSNNASRRDLTWRLKGYVTLFEFRLLDYVTLRHLCVGLCWINSVCAMFPSHPEWVPSACCCSQLALNEFSEPDSHLRLHWIIYLCVILLSGYTEWVLSVWYCSQKVNRFSEPDIALRLWMCSLSLILLSQCKRVLWAWYCSQVALNKFFESDIALR